MKEREKSKALFKSKEGKTQLRDIHEKAKTFVPGAPLPEATNKQTNPAGLTPEQVGINCQWNVRQCNAVGHPIIASK